MLVGIKKYMAMLIMGISALSFSFLRDVNPDALNAYGEF